MAHALLATTDDLAGVVGAAILAKVPSARQTQFLQQATDDALGRLRSRYVLPLVSWSSDLTGHVVNLAAWRCMRFVGFNPQGADDTWRTDYDASIEWLEDVKHCRTTPSDVVDSSVDVDEGGPRVSTGTSGTFVGSHAGTTSLLHTTRGW